MVSYLKEMGMLFAGLWLGQFFHPKFHAGWWAIGCFVVAMILAVWREVRISGRAEHPGSAGTV